jgi:rubrerythrin
VQNFQCPYCQTNIDKTNLIFAYKQYICPVCYSGITGLVPQEIIGRSPRECFEADVPPNGEAAEDLAPTSEDLSDDDRLAEALYEQFMARVENEPSYVINHRAGPTGLEWTCPVCGAEGFTRFHLGQLRRRSAAAVTPV